MQEIKGHKTLARFGWKSPFSSPRFEVPVFQTPVLHKGRIKRVCVPWDPLFPFLIIFVTLLIQTALRVDQKSVDPQYLRVPDLLKVHHLNFQKI